MLHYETLYDHRNAATDKKQFGASIACRSTFAMNDCELV